MKRILGISLVLATVAVSCTKREDTAPTSGIDRDWGISPNLAGNIVYDFPGLYYQPRNPQGIQRSSIYVPRRAFPSPQGDGQPVPLLVMLPPAFGSQNYFFERGLFALVEDMIEKGEIQPMIIVCLANERVFGGFYYANSIIGGFYDSTFSKRSLIDEALIGFKGLNVLPGRENRGAAGFGMGAYGALRAAIKHPDLFGAVSVTDGPLDFDGPTGTGGFTRLFDSAVAEVAPGTDPFFERFDSSSTLPYRTLFLSGGFAFSPHDTFATLTINTANGRLSMTNRLQVSDSSTLVPGVYDFLVTGAPLPLGLHLPFDSSGNTYAPVWGRWLRQNLDSLHIQAGSQKPLYGTDLFFAITPNAELTFHEQTLSFMSYARSIYGLGRVYSYEYGGISGTPASGNTYVYDVMREMLKFHSKRFGNF